MSLIPYHPREGREIVLCVIELPSPIIHCPVLHCLRALVLLLTLNDAVATTTPSSSATRTLIASRSAPPNARHATSRWAAPRPPSDPSTGSTR